MSSGLIPPEQLIERDGDVIRFKGVSDSGIKGAGLAILSPSTSFTQSNELGSLRSVSSVEEACLEGQKIAMELQRIFDK